MTRYIISPYAMHRVGETNRYEVAWNETDGVCGCGRIPKRGMVTYDGKGEPDIVDLEAAIRAKYYDGNNQSA